MTARCQIDLLDRSIRAKVASAWFGYDATLRAIDASKRQVDAAEIAYDGAKEELAVGVRTTLDVLDQEQAVRSPAFAGPGRTERLCRRAPIAPCDGATSAARSARC
ncbi:MAG: TolC family protein [Hyphomonas sp.]